MPETLTSAERYALTALAYGYDFGEAQKMSGVNARRLATLWRREKRQHKTRFWMRLFFGGRNV